MIIGAVMILGALALVLYNARDEKNASSSVDEILPKVVGMIEDNAQLREEQTETGTLPGDTGMGTVKVDGNEYIGFLNIPSVNIELPVLSSWSYPLLKISPCRYNGSVKGGSLVIAGHNFTRHFGKLGNMAAGDDVYFTDVDGTVTKYVVSEVITLQKTQIDEMNSSDWDLTLFTCTYGGKLRIAVRCERNMDGP